MLNVNCNVYSNDSIVGEKSTTPVILIGESALVRVGLTTLHNSVLKCSTLVSGVTGIWNPIVTWYFNPNANRYDHTVPSKKHPNILQPTQERALVEYMEFHDYFDEGILIEGIQTYLFQHNDDYSALIEEAKFWKFSTDMVEYWVNEAKEDYEV